ncbi:MAG TPA: murein L,D-transpeptidase catalytic domain family protein, partial [Ferruginibacter sp.]|nr:murein L,D-transpeptidase catalytic domain family protein [Ferruginibacter sp.]
MKKNWLKKVYVFFSPVLIALVHLPFVFAKSRPVHELKTAANKVIAVVSGDSPVVNTFLPAPSAGLSTMYDSMRLNMMGLSRQAYDYAMKGFNYLVEKGKIANSRIISIADFSLPSYKKRLFVIDLDNNKVLFNTYVAHGSNTGAAYAEHFSNTPESNQSSPGFYQTEQTYNGKNGYSLHLQGLEAGINDKAYDRAIVMHGADYVSENFIQARGYIGRSWGCPAVPESMSKPIIDRIKGGTCLFIYTPGA